MGDDSVRVPGEIHENVELFRSKTYFVMSHFHPPTGNVDVEIADINDRILRLFVSMSSTKGCSHSGQQFIHAEGLCYIVICACIECFHLNRFFPLY